MSSCGNLVSLFFPFLAILFAQLWKDENSFDPYSFFGGSEPEAPKEALTETKVLEVLDFILQ